VPPAGGLGAVLLDLESIGGGPDRRAADVVDAVRTALGLLGRDAPWADDHLLGTLGRAEAEIGALLRRSHRPRSAGAVALGVWTRTLGLLGEHSLAAPAAVLRELRRRERERDEPLAEAVAGLLAAGVGVGVVSDRLDDCRVGVAALSADAVPIMAVEVGWWPPAPGLYHVACGRLGVAPDEVAFVGRTARHRDGARAAGLRVQPAGTATVRALARLG
jgi:phosphoglycolate phosphatase-like HAD superfamily hydrolase